MHFNTFRGEKKKRNRIAGADDDVMIARGTHSTTIAPHFVRESRMQIAAMPRILHETRDLSDNRCVLMDF